MTSFRYWLHCRWRAVSLIYRVFKKYPSPKTFPNIFIYIKSFCMKICKFVGNSYPHNCTNFCKFTSLFHQMTLIFPRVPIVFTLSSFFNSQRKWKCSVPPFQKWRHFPSPGVLMSDNCKQSITVWFLSRVNILTRDSDIAILSVCLSVSPWRSGRWKRLNILS